MPNRLGMGGSSIQYIPPSQQAAIQQGVMNADRNAQGSMGAPPSLPPPSVVDRRRAMVGNQLANRASAPHLPSANQRSMAGMMGSVRGNANPTTQYIPPPNVSGQAQQYQAPPPQAQRGPTAEQIQAEMQRRQVGAQVGANPRNAAISGYMMGK